MHTAVVHQKAIFIGMPTEEVLPPFSFIALHKATKLSMLENSEVFLGRVGSGWLVFITIFKRLVFIIIFNLIFDYL